MFSSKLQIQSHNNQLRSGKFQYKLGFTSLSDVPDSEFAKMKGLGAGRPPVITRGHTIPYIKSSIPISVNWKGTVQTRI